MIRLNQILGKAWLGLLILGLVGVFAAAASAAGIGFRNDLNVRVVVQGASSINNVVRRGQPLVIDPGKTLWDSNLPAGNRDIVIYGVQPNRVLYRRAISFQGQDVLLSITLDRNGMVNIVNTKNTKK